MADGSIRIYSGLMEMMDDEKLLFVLGHEMGQVVEKHSVLLASVLNFFRRTFLL
jgi:Zn-dependent protease with chaperone function